MLRGLLLSQYSGITSIGCLELNLGWLQVRQELSPIALAHLLQLLRANIAGLGPLLLPSAFPKQNNSWLDAKPVHGRP